MPESFDYFGYTVVGVQPIGHKDAVIGYMGRGKKPTKRYPVIFVSSLNNNAGWVCRGRVRLMTGHGHDLRQIEVWQGGGIIAHLTFVPEAEAERLLVMLAKELL